MNTKIILLLFGLFCAANMTAQGTRIMLTQLERAPSISGSRAGMIGLSNANGDQRYAYYVNVGDTCITYTPTATGNSVVSIFVQKCATDSIWYIDWEGRSILLAPFGGAGSCDQDFLQISDNSCPTALTDSLYKYNYVSIGARYVWPDAELQVADSSTAAIIVINGARQARLVFYDNINELWSTMEEGGDSWKHYIVPDGTFTWLTAGGGTPEDPGTPFINHFGINTNDSTIQMYQYPRTRVDTQAVINFLYTDPLGKVRSQAASSFPGVGNGIYGGSDIIPPATDATLTPASAFSFQYSSTATALQIDDSNGLFLFSPTTSSEIDITDSYINIATNPTILSVGSTFLVSTPSLDLQYIGGGATAPQLRLYEPVASGANYSAFKSQAQSGDVTYTLPAADGSSGNVLSTNGSGALSWAAAGGACPTCFVDGGNSFGAAATLGTNDANTLSFETNNVTRATVTGGASTGGAWTVTDVTGNTNTIEDIVTYNTNSSGSATNSFGSALLFQAESSTTNNRPTGRLAYYWTIASDGPRTSGLGISTTTSGTLAERIFLNSTTMSFNQNYTLSSGSNILTLSSTGSGATAINFSNNSTSGSIAFYGGLSINALSGTKNWIDISPTIAPTSGTAISNILNFSPTINQTGGANGVIRPIYLNPTLTAVADFRGIDLPYSNANAKGIYQTGALTTNIFAGNTGIGATTAPSTALDVTGTTATGHLIGQDNTPTITVDAAGAGTGASASMVNAQSSDLAGRFSITTGTGSTTGRWCSVTFGTAFSVTPIVQVYCEDDDCSILNHYVNVSTSGFEWFVTSASTDSRTYEMNFLVTGGK